MKGIDEFLNLRRARYTFTFREYEDGSEIFVSTSGSSGYGMPVAPEKVNLVRERINQLLQELRNNGGPVG